MSGGSGGVEVGRISVRAVPNTDNFHRDLRDDLRRIEREFRAMIDVGINIDSNGLRERVRAVREAAQASLRDLRLGVDLDKSQLATAAFARTLNNVGDSAGNAASSLMSVNRSGAMVAGVLALVAPAVGLVSGLLAGLPSLAAGFAAGAGTITLGMDGIKAAASTLAPDLANLKTAISSTFQQQLTPAFEQLRTIFPTLQTGMNQVAVGLSGMFKGVTDSLTSGQGLSQIQTILQGTGSALQAMQPIVGTFTQSFLTLGSAGTQQFGLLTGVLGQFASQFNEMVNRITSNGAFSGAMQGMSQVLGSILTQFTNIMEVGVQAMGSLGGPLSNLINGFGQAFTAVMPMLTSMSGAVGNILGSLESNLAPIFTALTPAFTTLMDTLTPLVTGIFDQLGPVLAQVGTALSSALVPAFQALQPVMPVLAQAFGTIAQNVGNLLVTAINQLAPLLPQLVQGFVTMVPAIAQFLTATQPLATLLIAVVGAVLNLAVALVSKLVGGFNAVIGVVASVVTAVSNFVSSFTAGIDSATAKVSEFPAKVKAFFADAGNWLISAGKDLIQGFINGIASMAGAVIGKASEIASSAVGAVKNALGIHSPSRVMAEMGGYAGQGFANGLQDQKEAVVGAAKDVMQGVKDEVGKGIDWNSEIHKGIDIGGNFLEANGKQLMSDMGMGGGALTALGDQALQFGKQALSNFTFNVSNVDEAIAIKNNQLNKQALGMWRR